MNPDSIAQFRSLKAPATEVWRHLTRPELLARWLGAAEIELEYGGRVSVEAWNEDFARGRVVTFAPPSSIEIAWKWFDVAPEQRVLFRVQGDEGGSRITVIHDDLYTDAEQRHARATWRSALAALSAAVDEGRDAHEWGATIPVTIRTQVPRRAADLWPLLATSAGIQKWIAKVEAFDPVPGGGFRFISRYRGSDVVEEGRIEDLVPESRIAFSWEWRGEGWNGSTRVEMTLIPEASGSSLLLTHSGFDRIAADRAPGARRSYAEAWPEVVGDLKRLVSPLAAA